MNNNENSVARILIGRLFPTASPVLLAEVTYEYDSFGRPLDLAANWTPMFPLYAEREYDPDTELYYYRARWYDPQARRFISEDPIGLAGGINLYAYVNNNPMNYVGPYGLLDYTASYKQVME